jgi:hypothetical protein
VTSSSQITSVPSTQRVPRRFGSRVSSIGPYTLRVAGTDRRIRVSDAQIMQGAIIPIGG